MGKQHWGLACSDAGVNTKSSDLTPVRVLGFCEKDPIPYDKKKIVNFVSRKEIMKRTVLAGFYFPSMALPTRSLQTPPILDMIWKPRFRVMSLMPNPSKQIYASPPR